MKPRLSLTLLAFLVLAYQPNLWAIDTSNQVVTTDTAPPDSDDSTEFNHLASKASDEGSVQVMVVLKEGLDADEFSLDEQEKIIEKAQNSLLKDVPIRRIKSIKRFKRLPVLAFSASESELQRLQTSPDVAEIVEDHMNLPLSHEASLAKIGANLAVSSAFTGAGQSIAILDNGVDKNQLLLQGKVVAEACFSTKNSGKKVSSSCKKKRTRDLRPGSASVTCAFQDFACTHGTVLAALAAGSTGVAPLASIISVRVDSQIKNKKICGSTQKCSVFFDSDLLRGLDFVYRKRSAFKIAAVNVSIGGVASAKQCKRSPFRKIVAKLQAANIATIAASGNDGRKTRLSSPACVKGVISVGTTNNTDAIMAYSNSASTLSLLAPGDKIGLPMPGVVSSGFEVVASGTSLSAAITSGAWAALKQQSPSATVSSILGKLTSTGVLLTDTNGLPKPRIQLNKALGL
jgi:hypothetical protein